MIARIAQIVLLCACLAAMAPPSYSAPAAAPQIAITIDDMDLNADTPRLNPDQRNEAILAALRDAHLKAAVFVAGYRVDSPAGLERLRTWSKAGHLIANHTYSHWYYPDTPFEKFSADVLRVETLIQDYPGFTKLFRFPYLKEGATPQQRDAMRAFLKAHGYRMGYVTVDASDWAIDARLRKRLAAQPDADISAYRNFYLEHLWDRAQFYDGLSRQVLGRPTKHTLLLHHNLAAALFLDDVIKMFRAKGWQPIDADVAFTDPVFSREPANVPAGESIVWALAKESGKFESVLRYPGEDEKYEAARMDALGL